MNRRGWLVAVIGGAMLTTSIASIATPTDSAAVCVQAATTSEAGCQGALLLKAGGGVIPRRLPKHELAPVAVKLWGTISTVVGDEPSPLKEVKIDFDRNVAVDATGIPSCNPNIQYEETGLAGSICKGSIIGEGSASFEIAPGESAPGLVNGMFNGKLDLIYGGLGRDGVMYLYADAYLNLQIPTVLEIRLEVTKIHKGPYGLQVVARIPTLEGGLGALLNFHLDIKRLFKYRGTKQSFALARCPSSPLSAKIGALFTDGQILDGTVTRPCTATG